MIASFFFAQSENSQQFGIGHHFRCFDKKEQASIFPFGMSCAIWASYFHSCLTNDASNHKFCPDGLGVMVQAQESPDFPRASARPHTIPHQGSRKSGAADLQTPDRCQAPCSLPAGKDLERRRVPKQQDRDAAPNEPVCIADYSGHSHRYRSVLVQTGVTPTLNRCWKS